VYSLVLLVTFEMAYLVGDVLWSCKDLIWPWVILWLLVWVSLLLQSWLWRLICTWYC